MVSNTRGDDESRHWAHDSGNLLVPTAAAARAGVQTTTLQRYLRLLDMSYVAFLLPAWERNAHKRLAKSPKLHFWDPISRELEPGIRAHSITAFLS